MPSILVIRLSSLGDVILATALVRQISRSMPDAAIDVAVDARFAEVWAHNPRVRKVYTVDRAKRTNEDLIRQAGQAPYDIVADLQKNRRSAQLVASMSLPASTQMLKVAKHRLEKLALVWLKRPPRVVTPVVKRYWNTVRHLGIEYDELGPEVWTDNESVAMQQPRTVVGLAPGARHATKRWTVAGFAELARDLVNCQGQSVVLLGGPDDVRVCDEIEALAGAVLERADGATDLSSTIHALDRCRAVVSNDSALMHLARARRVPVVAIFGSTSPELGFAPQGEDVRIIESRGLSCRPCTHIGRDSCPKGHFRCMTDIAPDAVVSAVSELLTN
jgi:heptosyltransferase-2